MRADNTDLLYSLKLYQWSAEKKIWNAVKSHFDKHEKSHIQNKMINEVREKLWHAKDHVVDQCRQDLKNDE